LPGMMMWLKPQMFLWRIFPLTDTVKLRLTNVSFVITMVYGPTLDADKPRFLDELKASKLVEDQLWLCFGDFNPIYSVQDKNNLNLNRHFMGLFRWTLDQCELLEIALQNCKYTCINERDKPTLVRLDRVFCNKELDLAFPFTYLQALSPLSSDHYPLLLAQLNKQLRHERFKFEMF
jgi:endonuclease/exonuclease/phosphatase family metal-dependent hydrolase